MNDYQTLLNDIIHMMFRKEHFKLFSASADRDDPNPIASICRTLIQKLERNRIQRESGGVVMFILAHPEDVGLAELDRLSRFVNSMIQNAEIIWACIDDPDAQELSVHLVVEMKCDEVTDSEKDEKQHI